jgi:hypothetical protein
VTFLRAQLASVVESIEGVGEGIVTSRALKALLAFRGAAMFVSFRMTAE